MLTQRPAAIDACSLLNILASGFATQLLPSVSPERWVAKIVADEVLYLRADSPTSPPEQIDLSPLLDTEQIKVCRLESPEEEELYVQLAADLDDGEAMSVALSARRGLALVTDDRKAIRLANEIGVLETFSTPDLLRASGLKQVASAIKAIEHRSRFCPAKDHPLRTWWDDLKV